MTANKDNSPPSHPAASEPDTLLCRKTGRHVSGDDPHCQARGKPCRFRINCPIYAMEQYNRRAPEDERIGNTYRVTFLPENLTAVVTPAVSLLDAARRADAHIASPCGGAGLCGKCKVLVKQGEVRALPTQLLSEADRKAGYVLACRTFPQSDVTVETPLQAREEDVQALGDETESVLSFDDGSSQQAQQQPDTAGLDPLVRRLVVSVEPPTLVEPTGDFERVCDKISRQTGESCRTASLSALRDLPRILRSHDWRAALYAERMDGAAAIIKVAPPTAEKHCGLALDIGTTTIVAQLIDLQSGRIIGARGALNRQSTYGEDVLTRIIHACSNQKLDTLHALALDTVNHLTHDLCETYDCPPPDIHAAVCAGNTTMTHLFLGIPPCTIRLEPFVSVTNFPPRIRAGEIGLKILPEAPVVIAPGMSGYVGGDITAGIMASGLAEQTEPCVLIDIGTNGEVAVGNRDWLIACASSAGPAFEGGGIRCGMRAANGAIQRCRFDAASSDIQVETVGDVAPLGLCGSGLIDSLAALLRAGWIDRSGKFTDRAPSGRIRSGPEGKEIVLIPAERAGGGRDIVLGEAEIAHAIRSKGAIFTAVLLLLEKVGLSLSDIHHFYVAGGFGNYLNRRNAVLIGLLPDLPVERFRFIGNASLAGARMALLHRRREEDLAAIARRTTYVELCVEPQFMDRYGAALFLPHTDVALFPTVA